VVFWVVVMVSFCSLEVFLFPSFLEIGSSWYNSYKTGLLASRWKGVWW